MSEKIASELIKLAKELTAKSSKWSKFNKWIPSNADVEQLTKFSPKGTDLEVWTWKNPNAKRDSMQYTGLVLHGQVKKPQYIWGRSPSDVERFVDREIKKRKKVIERKQERQKEQKEFEHGYEVGDFIYSSWGYDQTNVNFYQVVGLTPRGVKIREVAKKVVKESGAQEYVVPVPNKFIDSAMTKRVSPGYGGGAGRVKIDSVQSGSKWDGNPKYQTAFGFGH